ncbi:MAG: adenylate/guanylate cyclase domain-containing protein [Candidatus Puniceispirillaceae bacterium]
MKPDELLQHIQEQLSQAPTDNAALLNSLTELKSLYDKQARQLNHLTKLSDNTEAKLTEANKAMENLLRNLSRFVPDAVVQTLMTDGAEQIPKNSREKITVFFSDVVGFTTITERLEPERLAPLMTEYFTVMTEICTKWEGTLDQFIGDAIVIFFGAPRSKGIEDDARRAVGMAIEMQQSLEILRSKWASQGMSQPFNVRMGIATGYCNVGNFGSHERLHYTAIGTAVNSAARIQSLAKPNEILIADDTYMTVRDHYLCHEDQTTILSGHKHPITLYSASLNQQDWQNQTITASADGYRFYFDPSAVNHPEKVTELLQSALATISQHQTKAKS